MILDRIALKREEKNLAGKRVISATKAVTWRILGTIDTWAISYFVTGKVDLAFSIASFEVFTKMVLYYFHERAWEKISLHQENKTKP